MDRDLIVNLVRELGFRGTLKGGQFHVKDSSKKKLLRFMSKSVLPMFSLRIFVVSGLTFRSSIYSEFIFVMV